jgi:hypothetical protein
MRAPQWLTALGIPEDCISRASSAKGLKRSFSIRPQEGDQIWRVKVDDCWFQSCDEKRVDYLFWAQSASGQKFILLVELKGQHFGKALQQIESTLQRLCKRAGGRGIHTGQHRDCPGHNPHNKGGVRAYAVLSKGEGVPLRQRERERIRQRYGILVHPKSQRLEADGIDALP